MYVEDICNSQKTLRVLQTIETVMDGNKICHRETNTTHDTAVELFRNCIVKDLPNRYDMTLHRFDQTLCITIEYQDQTNQHFCKLITN